MSFADLKRSSKTSIENLKKEVEKISNPQNNSSDDDRFWQPTVDKVGNGSAVIRFLPCPGFPDKLPFVRFWDHGFQGPGGKWYIEKSLTTLGKDDPVSQHNTKLWATGTEENKKIARDRKRRLHYVSNILVIEDPANRENEGKVFLFKYGKKLFDKIKEVMFPEFEDETPFDPFNLWNGANFSVKIRKVEGYRNYDKSKFLTPSPLSTDEAKMEEVFNQCVSLDEFIDPSNYKSYDELLRKFNFVIGASDDEVDDPTPKSESPAKKTRTSKMEEEKEDSPPWEEDEDESELSFFKNLAKE